MKTHAPTSILEGLPPAFVDGGIPAWVVPDARLELLKPEIVTWMIIP